MESIVREVKKQKTFGWIKSTISRFFFTFNEQIMPKNWKRTIKQW